MSEINQFIKAMSDGIRAFSKGMEILANQLDEYATETRYEKAAVARPDVPADNEPKNEKPAETRETVSKKPRGEAKTKAKPKRALRPDSDIGKVYQAISDSDGGINVETLTEATGFKRQKIYGIVNRLKNQDRIQKVKQGVYESV